MADKTFKVSPGEEIEISIRRKKKSEIISLPPPRRKGIIDPFRRDEFLPRRLNKQTYIRFFDLAQILTGGVFQTNEAGFFPVVSVQPNSTSFSAPVTNADAFAVYNTIKNEIDLIDFEVFPETFFEIKKGSGAFEKAVTVNITVSGTPTDIKLIDATGDIWTPAGLKLTSEQALALVIKPEGALWNSSAIDFSEMKITIENDYNAPEFPFTPSTKMDIYLMPTLIFHGNSSEYKNGLMTGATFNDHRHQHDLLNNQVQVFPRAGVADYFDFVENASGLDAYQINYRYMLLSKLFPDQRAKRAVQEINNANPTEYVFSSSNPSPSDVPFADIYQPNAPNNQTNVYSVAFGSNFGFYTTVDMRLKAIVIQNGDFYYMWQT